MCGYSPRSILNLNQFERERGRGNERGKDGGDGLCVEW